MGCKTTDLSEERVNSPSLSDALLFTTMCIIGLSVEVQVKDGSIYSGIFHTASVERDYGIVLKKAKMTKKGKNEANLANGTLVDTLVVLSRDLVQVVAKGVLLPADGIVGNVAGDDIEAVTRSVRSLEYPDTELKTLKSTNAAPEVFAAETKKISQTRSSCPKENKSAYGLTNTNIEAVLLKNIEKSLDTRETAAKYLGSALEIETGLLDGMHISKIEEASLGAVVTVDVGQVGEDRSQGEKNGSDQIREACKDDNNHEVQPLQSSSSSNAILPLLKSINGVREEISSNMSPNGTSSGSSVPSLVKPHTQDCERPTLTVFSPSDVLASDVSTSSTSLVDITSQSCPSPSSSPAASVALKALVSNMSAKEFKLNPGAKMFLPSFAIPRSAAPAVTTVPSMAYIPNNAPMVPVAGAQPEIGISPFAPRSSLPVKFVQYNNVVAVNGGSGSQYSQPIVGHVGNRVQPVRYAGQYTPVQAGPAYVHPNSQAVMVGRLGQVVYVHPVSHDVIQGAATLSQVSARPLLTPQAHLSKHQGSAAAQPFQLCVAPSTLIAGGQQPVAVPSHIPFSQPPFPAVRSIPVPGASGLFSSKLP